MRVTGAATVAAGVVLVTVAKPTTATARSHLVNGPVLVAAGGYGAGTFEPTMALYNSGSGTPAVGEIWGPKSGQWSLEKNQPGYAILGGAITSGTPRVLVREYTTITHGYAQLYGPSDYTGSPTETEIAWGGYYPSLNVTGSTSTEDFTIDVAGAYHTSLSLELKRTSAPSGSSAGPAALVAIKRGSLYVAVRTVNCPTINGTSIWVDAECQAMRDDYAVGDVLNCTIAASENIDLGSGTFEIEKID
jgi:hypothetical protein